MENLGTNSTGRVSTHECMSGVLRILDQEREDTICVVKGSLITYPGLSDREDEPSSSEEDIFYDLDERYEQRDEMEYPHFHIDDLEFDEENMEIEDDEINHEVYVYDFNKYYSRGDLINIQLCCGSELDDCECDNIASFCFYIKEFDVMIILQTNKGVYRIDKFLDLLYELGLEDVRIYDRRHYLLDRSTYFLFVNSCSSLFSIENDYSGVMAINWNRIMHAQNGNMEEDNDNCFFSKSTMDHLDAFYDSIDGDDVPPQRNNNVDSSAAPTYVGSFSSDEAASDNGDLPVNDNRVTNKIPRTYNNSSFIKNGKVFKNGEMIGFDKSNQKRNRRKKDDISTMNKPEEKKKLANQYRRKMIESPKVTDDEKSFTQVEDKLPELEEKIVAYNTSIDLLNKYIFRYTRPDMKLNLNSSPNLWFLSKLRDIGSTFDPLQECACFVTISCTLIQYSWQTAPFRMIKDFLSYTFAKIGYYDIPGNHYLTMYYPSTIMQYVGRFYRSFSPRVVYTIIFLMFIRLLFRWGCKVVNNNTEIIHYRRHVIKDIDNEVERIDKNETSDLRRQADKNFKIELDEIYVSYTEKVSDCVTVKIDLPLFTLNSGEIKVKSEQNTGLIASKEVLMNAIQPRSVNMSVSSEALLERMAGNIANAPYVNSDKGKLLSNDIYNDTSRLATAIQLHFRCNRKPTCIYDVNFRKEDTIRLVCVPPQPTPSYALIRNLWSRCQNVLCYLVIEPPRWILNQVMNQMSLCTQLPQHILVMMRSAALRWPQAASHIQMLYHRALILLILILLFMVSRKGWLISLLPLRRES